jgi:hypothetical protein
MQAVSTSQIQASYIKGKIHMDEQDRQDERFEN